MYIYRENNLTLAEKKGLQLLLRVESGEWRRITNLQFKKKKNISKALSLQTLASPL